MSDHVEAIVVGAGVIGLAIARALARAGREVIILEAGEAIGTGISARNSEVIHAGIYYPKESLKAQLCRRGKLLLYEYCESHGIPYKRLGKLIVATEQAELAALNDILGRAKANGVDDLELLDGGTVHELEPELRAQGALLSPSTGIIDAAALMLALLGDAETAGAQLALATPVMVGNVGDGPITLDVGGASPMKISCDRLINAAGLGAAPLARRLKGLAPEFVPPSFYAKGNYFTLSRKAPFTHLIYPVPTPGGLGTHATLDMGGQVRFGPDVEWVDGPDAGVNPARADLFEKAIRRYWPGLPDGALEPGYAGVRPKLAGPDGGAWGTDFVIQGPDAHGHAGLVNLYGIESPGLTSSLAIAELVASIL